MNNIRMHTNFSSKKYDEFFIFSKKSKFYSFYLNIGTAHNTWTKNLFKDWSYIFHERLERQFESTSESISVHYTMTCMVNPPTDYIKNIFKKLLNNL